MGLQREVRIISQMLLRESLVIAQKLILNDSFGFD